MELSELIANATPKPWYSVGRNIYQKSNISEDISIFRLYVEGLTLKEVEGNAELIVYLVNNASAIDALIEAARDIIHAEDNTATAIFKMKLNEALANLKD